MHENRETSETPAVKPGSKSAGEGLGRTARMYVPEESHDGIVPMNHSNKDKRPLAESEEGRPSIKENACQPHTYPTQSGKGVSQGLAGVRKAARENKEMKFTALLHHLTVDLLRKSFYALKRKAAPGVDGVTWQEYETGLEGRLVDLHNRVHRGAYRAKPSRRVFIPKPDGRQRPLGVAALEDKVVQVGRARLPQLPRGAGKHGQPWGLSGKGDSALATNAPMSQPETPAPLDPNASLGGRWLPQPRVLHPYPEARFAAQYPR